MRIIVSLGGVHPPDVLKYPLDFGNTSGKFGVTAADKLVSAMFVPKQSKKPKTTAGSRNKKAVQASRNRVDYKSLAEFRFRLRQFLGFSEANARKNSLTSQQYQALLTIKGLSGPHSHMSVGELAEFLLVKHHTAVGLINRMVRSGLLKRVRDSRDGRRIGIMLTSKGDRKLSNVAELNWEELRSGRLLLPKMLKSSS